MQQKKCGRDEKNKEHLRKAPCVLIWRIPRIRVDPQQYGAMQDRVCATDELDGIILEFFSI